MKRYYNSLVKLFFMMYVFWSCGSKTDKAVNADDKPVFGVGATAIFYWGNLDYGKVKISDLLGDVGYHRNVKTERYYYIFDDYIYWGDTSALPVTVFVNPETNYVSEDSIVRGATLTFKNMQQTPEGISFQFTSEQDLMEVYSILLKRFGKPLTVKDTIRTDRLPDYACWSANKCTVDFSSGKPRKHLGKLVYGVQSVEELKQYHVPKINFAQKPI